MTFQSLTNESVDEVVQRANHILAGLDESLPRLVDLYRDLHRNP